MAMIKCIECGKQFSDRAAACPNCGCPTSVMTGEKSDVNFSITIPSFGPSSEEATKKMKEAVAAARNTASSADRAFDSDNRRIQRMASGSIDLFGGTAVTQVADIAQASKKACDDLYAALQMALITLNATCRPLLTSKPDGTAIRDVYYEIKQLNSDSEISNTFTASLNYNNLGDMATRRYSPSVEAKMIESFWRSEYDKIKKDMDRIESERRTKEEASKRAAAEKKRKEKEAFQDANRDKINEYALKAKKSVSILSELEKQAFAKKKDEMTKNREAEKTKVESSITKTAESRIAEIKKEQASTDKDYVNTVTNLRRELDEEKATLASLGLFKGAHKKALNIVIEDLVTRLQKTTEDYREKTTKFEKQIASCEEEKKKNLKKEYEAIETRFPLPEMVKKREKAIAKVSPENQPTPMQLVNESMRDAIYEYLLTVDLATIEDIINGCPAVSDMTNQRVSAIVRGMIGIQVERVEEKRKAYFRAIEGHSKKKALPNKQKNPIDVVEEFVKNKQVSFNKLNVNLEDYQKYGSLKFLASDEIIYCEEVDKELNIYYIPEEYRKMN